MSASGTRVEAKALERKKKRIIQISLFSFCSFFSLFFFFFLFFSFCRDVALACEYADIASELDPMSFEAWFCVVNAYWKQGSDVVVKDALNKIRAVLGTKSDLDAETKLCFAEKKLKQVCFLEFSPVFLLIVRKDAKRRAKLQTKRPKNGSC